VRILDLKCPNYPDFGGKDVTIFLREKEREEGLGIVNYLMGWPNNSLNAERVVNHILKAFGGG
jgi:hypothetical protein